VELESELLGPGSGSSCWVDLGDDLAVVLGIVLALVVDLDLDRIGLSAFSVAAAFLVRAAGFVDGFGAVGAEPWVATSAGMSSVMPWGDDCVRATGV
jgi:hypothetical protein